MGNGDTQNFLLDDKWHVDITKKLNIILSSVRGKYGYESGMATPFCV